MKLLNLIKRRLLPKRRLQRADIADSEGIHRLRQLIAEGDCDRVFEFLNKVKAEPPRVGNTDFLRAICFLRSGQNAAAIEALKEELRWFPEHREAAAMLRDLAREVAPQVAPGDDEFRAIFEVIEPATMLSPARLWSLFSHAREVCRRDLPGNFVECGVAAGGSSAMLATVLARHSKRERRLFSCDTFEGMPRPSELDSHEGSGAEATGWGAGTCSAPIDSLLALCRNLHVEHLVEPVKGLFSDTLPKQRQRIGPIALLHMDGDWYSSTRDILENLFDQVVPGATIQIDDYGYWEGCKRAVTEFEEKRGLKFELHPIDETGVWMVK